MLLMQYNACLLKVLSFVFFFPPFGFKLEEEFEFFFFVQIVKGYWCLGSRDNMVGCGRYEEGKMKEEELEA